MRGRLWVLMLALLAIAGGGSAVQAESTAPRPLMVNEVRNWCPDHGYGLGTECDHGAYTVQADGSIHVILNVDSGGLTDPCIPGLTIPDDVTGWAFVANDARGEVIPLEQVTPEMAVCELIASR